MGDTETQTGIGTRGIAKLATTGKAPGFAHFRGFFLAFFIWNQVEKQSVSHSTLTVWYSGKQLENIERIG